MHAFCSGVEPYPFLPHVGHGAFRPAPGVNGVIFGYDSSVRVNF